MDFVTFENEKYNAVFNGLGNHWNMLRQLNSRFAECGVIRGEEPIEELSREAVLTELDSIKLIAEAGGDIPERLAFYDFENETIWIMTPFKMALLLHQIDTAWNILMGGYPIELGEFDLLNDIRLRPIPLKNCNPFQMQSIFDSGLPYDISPGDQSKNDTPIWMDSVEVSTMDLIMADRDIPMDVICTILSRMSLNCPWSADIYEHLNVVNEKRNEPKRTKEIMEAYDNDEFYTGIDQFSRNIEVIMRKNVISEYGTTSVNKFTQEECRNIVFNSKSKLQLQLDLSRLYIEKNKMSNLQNLIEGLNVNYMGLEECEINQHYNWNIKSQIGIDIIQALVKQREVLSKVLIPYPKIREKLFVAMLVEKGCIDAVIKSLRTIYEYQGETNSNPMDWIFENKSHPCDITSERLEKLEKLLSDFDRVINSAIPEDTNAERMYRLLFTKLSEVQSSNVGWGYVGYNHFYKYVYAVNNLAQIVGNCPRLKITTKIVRFMEYMLGMCIGDETQLQNDIQIEYQNEKQKALTALIGCIDQFEGDPGVGKTASHYFSRLISKLVTNDDEVLFDICIERGLLPRSYIPEVINNVFQAEKYHRIPFLVSRK